MKWAFTKQCHDYTVSLVCSTMLWKVWMRRLNYSVSEVALLYHSDHTEVTWVVHEHFPTQLTYRTNALRQSGFRSTVLFTLDTVLMKDDEKGFLLKWLFIVIGKLCVCTDRQTHTHTYAWTFFPAVFLAWQC